MDDFSASPTVVAPGETVTLQVDAHDPDCPDSCTSGCGLYVRADLTVWSATGGAFVSEDNGASGSPYTATAEWQAPADEGTYTLSVALSDSGTFLCGGRQTATADLDVLVTSSANQPPVVESLTAVPVQLFPGEISQLSCIASDPEGDPVTYAWQTDHGTVTPGAGGAANFTAGEPGIATVECTATDPGGAFDTVSIQLAVSGAESEKALSVSLIAPQRLAVDSTGDVYVVDSDAGGLVVIHLLSNELVYRLRLPGLSSVAVDWNDDLLLGGIGGAELRDRQGGLIRALDPGAALGRVADVAIDPVNHRYGVLYGGPGRIVIFDEQGGELAAFGSIGDGAAQLKSPQGLAATPAGDWVVADSGHGLVRRFDLGGNLLSSFGGLGGGAGEFIQLNDVAVDSAGLIYASDAFQAWVQVFNPDGSLREVLGTYGDQPGQFRTPTGIAPVDPFDRLLTASLNTSSVQVFVTSGDPVTSGPAPMGELSPTDLVFADQAVQTESAPRDVTLSNTGAAPLGVRAVAVDGDFTQSNDCGPFVDPGQSCSFSIRFMPLVPGPASGTITLDTSDPGTALVVTLNGSGFVPPGVQLLPDHLRFSDQEVGTVSDPKLTTLTNTGTVPLGISDVTVSGEFFATHDCPGSLDGGASCTISVRSAPLTVNDDLLGAVLVASSAAGSPHRVALRGRGVQGPIEVSVADVTVAENDPAGEAAFTVALSAVSEVAIQVDFATEAATALAGEDYTAVAGTLEIPAGLTSRTISVPIVDDDVLEPDEESFRLVLTNPLNATLADGEALGTILDDELCPGPNLLINPGAELRTDDGAISGWTQVAGGDWHRRFAQPDPFAGRAYFFGGSTQQAELVQDVDMSAWAGRIAAGGQRFAFDAAVRTAGEDLARLVVEYRDEANSTVLDTFDSGDLGSVGGWTHVGDERPAPPGTGWIRVRLLATRAGQEGPNDVYLDELSLRSVRAAALSMAGPWVYEGDAGISQADFVVNLACRYHREVRFDHATADGTATAGVDYLATAGSEVIAVGETAAEVPVSIVGDQEVEGHETVLLAVAPTSPGEAVVVASPVIGTIADDDFCPRGPGYWKQPPRVGTRRAPSPTQGRVWPVSWLLIGGVEYELGELGEFLSARGPDATLHLTRQLVATKLNLASGSSPSILGTVEAADELLADYPPGSGPGADSDAGRMAELLKALLEAYNEGPCQ